MAKERTPSAPAAPGLLAHLEARLADTPGTVDDPDLPDRVCRAVVEVLDVDGAAISVYLGGDVAVPVGASDLEATTGEALQFTAREGPCFESYTSRKPVLVADLHDEQSRAWSHWPAYAANWSSTPPIRGFRVPAAGTRGRRGLARPVPALRANSGEVSSVVARIAQRLLEAELSPGPDGHPQHRWLDGPAGRRRRQVWLAQGITPCGPTNSLPGRP